MGLWDPRNAYWGEADKPLDDWAQPIIAYGLCLWRLGNYDEAMRVFQRMLWLNPSDNQGIRFIIDEVRMKKAWKDDGY